MAKRGDTSVSKKVPVGFGLVTIGSQILDGRTQDSHFETTRSIANGHFLPGFPSMAEPMTAWVLDTYYERGNDRFTRTLVLQGAREADLLSLMEKFIEKHPTVTFSSLPRFVEGTEVHLGLSGNLQDVENGIKDLIEKLEAMGVRWEEKIKE